MHTQNHLQRLHFVQHLHSFHFYDIFKLHFPYIFFKDFLQNTLLFDSLAIKEYLGI